MFKKRLIATLTLIATIASLVVAFTVPVAAVDSYTATADNYGLEADDLFKPVKKNPFVTDSMDLTDAIFTDSDMFGPFQLETKYYQCGDAIQFYSPSKSAVWVMPVGMAHAGVTFVAPKTGKIDIKITAWKEQDNATESRVGIGINNKHYGENDITDALTVNPSEKTFTYDVQKDDVIAIIGYLPNGGDSGNLYFSPVITYHDDGGTPDTSDSVVLSIALVVVVSATAFIASKKRR